jgi:hypothetical protein
MVKDNEITSDRAMQRARMVLRDNAATAYKHTMVNELSDDPFPYKVWQPHYLSDHS